MSIWIRLQGLRPPRIHLIVLYFTGLIVETRWWKRPPNASQKLFPNNANLARIRYGYSITLTKYENQKHTSLCYFCLDVSKISLYSSINKLHIYPSILNYIEITIQLLIKYWVDFHEQVMCHNNRPDYFSIRYNIMHTVCF